MLNFNTGIGQIDSLLNSTVSGVQSGNSVGSSLSGVVSGVISPYTSILNVVGLGGAFTKTFGNVLANGFNLSCWGSSKDPAKIKGILQANYVPYFNTLLTNLQMGDVVSVNRFIKDVYITHSIAVMMQTATKWDSCSKKGLLLYLDFLNPLKSKADALVSEFLKTGAKNNVQKMPRHISLASYVPEGSDMKVQIDVPVLTYAVSSVKTKVGVKDLQNHMIDVTKPLTKEPTFDGGELKQVVVKQNKSEGFPWWVLALGLGMM